MKIEFKSSEWDKHSFLVKEFILKMIAPWGKRLFAD